MESHDVIAHLHLPSRAIATCCDTKMMRTRQEGDRLKQMERQDGDHGNKKSYSAFACSVVGGGGYWVQQKQLRSSGPDLQAAHVGLEEFRAKACPDFIGVVDGGAFGRCFPSWRHLRGTPLPLRGAEALRVKT
jgi:hypothetical protein